MSGFTLSTGVMGRRIASLLALSALVLRLACTEGAESEWVADLEEESGAPGVTYNLGLVRRLERWLRGSGLCSGLTLDWLL